MSQILAQRITEKVSGQIDKQSGISQYMSIKWSFFNTLKLNLKRTLPLVCKCLCLRESTRDRMFNRGFNKLREEIKITSIIKTLRILKAHAKKDFSQIQWRLFKLQKGIRQLHLLPNNDKDKERNVFKQQPFRGKV